MDEKKKNRRLAVKKKYKKNHENFKGKISGERFRPRGNRKFPVYFRSRRILHFL